jgi:hypothetical protein
MRIALVYLFISTFFVSVGMTKDYYVSPGGSDQNSGTVESPFATIGKGVSTALPGDNVLLLPGSYNQRTVISNSGSAEEPITIKSSSSDPDQFATIDRNMTPTNSGNGCVEINNNASWITFENIKFQNCWTNIIDIEKGNYITFRGIQALGGRHVVYAEASSSNHHILIENSTWQQDKRIWDEWKSQADWEDMHHGSRVYYNGGLFGSAFSGMGGAVVIRNNRISYAFNGIRWWGSQSGTSLISPNIEIYDNVLEFIRDNGVEPEGHAYNLHIYHNLFNHIPKGVLSYDSVGGGDVYFYGNRGYLDPAESLDMASWTVYKLKEAVGFTSGRLYIYHNSFYTRRAFGHCTSDACGPITFLRSFNGAYEHIDKDMGPKRDWGTQDHIFDYDISSEGWTTFIEDRNQEANGICAQDPMFSDPLNGDFRLNESSPAIDKGKVIANFTQSYEGAAPDMGAYEGDQLVEGPAFEDLTPSVGLVYVEKPRITRHRVKGSVLRLFFSRALDPTTISANNVFLKAGTNVVTLDNVEMGSTQREVVITSKTTLEGNEVAVKFDPMPQGTNGQMVTYWASTIGVLPEDLDTIATIDTIPPSAPQNLRTR